MDEVVDMAGAARAQAALVVWAGPGEDAQSPIAVLVAMEGQLTAALGLRPIRRWRRWGCSWSTAMTEHALPLKLAFNKGAGGLDDRIIHAATRSVYSHDELKRGDTFRSASSRDGGMKIKQINPAPDRWTLLPLEGWQRYDAWDSAEAELGQPYDLAGIWLNFTVPLRRHRRQSWFCSEPCAYALGLSSPHTLAPRDLFDRVPEVNAAYLAGYDDAGLIRSPI